MCSLFRCIWVTEDPNTRPKRGSEAGQTTQISADARGYEKQSKKLKQKVIFNRVMNLI